MPSKQNKQEVAELKKKVEQSESVIFAKYTGLTVMQFNELRRRIKEAGGEIVVAKNRLVNLALGAPQGLADLLQDQLFTLFSYDDPVSAIKELYKFKDDNEAVEIRGGWFEEKVLATNDVDQLSKIPGKTELLGQLVRGIQGPIYGLRNSLSAGPQNLVFALQALAKQKESEQK